MRNTSRSRIEAYENGRRIPMTAQPPVLGVSFSSGRPVILEKHLTPKAAEYSKHSFDTHVLYLSDSQPVDVSCRADGRSYKGSIHPGSVWMIPRFLSHSSVFGGPHGGIVLSIGTSSFERHVAPLIQGGRLELGFEFDTRDEQIEYLLKSLQAVAQDGPQPDALLGDLLINALCVRVARRYAVSKLNAVPRQGGLSIGQLKKVSEYISENLTENISLSILANTVHLSLFHFATAFKKSTGISPHRYVVLQRVQRAQELLRDKRRSVLDIALDVGFEHAGNFARAFRRVTGTSPKEFRRDHR